MSKQSILGNILVLGIGSMGASLLSLLDKHFKVFGKKIAVSTHYEHKEIATSNNFEFRQELLSPSNFRRLLVPILSPGSILINLSMDVSSSALIDLCREKNALYVDGGIEPWPGIYGDHRVTPLERSSAYFRKTLIENSKPDSSTAIVAHGSNPGLVSHFLKQGLADLAMLMGLDKEIQLVDERSTWQKIAKALGVRMIQISERDWQTPKEEIPTEILGCSWSVDGFVAEAFGQAGEIGWGSHEVEIPKKAVLHKEENVVLLSDSERPHVVKAWTPMSGEHSALLFSSEDASAITSFLSFDSYSPSCHSAYRPMDDAWKAKDWPVWRVLSLSEGRKKVFESAELDGGYVELGVLLMGEKFGSYWVGVSLSHLETKMDIPASSVMSSAGILCAISYALENPRKGLIQALDMEYSFALSFCEEYIGKPERKIVDWIHEEDSLNFKSFIVGEGS